MHIIRKTLLCRESIGAHPSGVYHFLFPGNRRVWSRLKQQGLRRLVEITFLLAQDFVCTYKLSRLSLDRQRKTKKQKSNTGR
jgi:hypothetical protein